MYYISDLHSNNIIMKNILIIISTLFLTLTSCNLEEKFQNSFNNTVSSFRQDITEKIIIEAIDFVQENTTNVEFDIDTSEIIEQINNNSGGLIDVEDITLDDIEIKLIEGSRQADFDFIDALSLTLSTIDNLEPIILDFGEIEQGATSLTLPEGTDTSILRLIEETDQNEINVVMNLVTNTDIENDIEIELISILLAQLGIGL